MQNGIVTVFEFCLNFREDQHESYWFMADMLALFKMRATEMRRGILGSPRGESAKQREKTIPPYRSPFLVTEMDKHVCVMSERFTKSEIEADVIPKNLFASRVLGQPFYGVVLVCRISPKFQNIRDVLLDIDFEFSSNDRELFASRLKNKDRVQTYSFVTVPSLC